MEENKSNASIQQQAEEFASTFANKETEQSAWRVLFDAAIHFYKMGANKYGETQLEELSREVLITILNDVKIPTENAKEATQAVAEIAVMQAKALINELNKTKSFTSKET